MSHYSGLAVDIQNLAEHIDPHINQNPLEKICYELDCNIGDIVDYIKADGD